MLIKTENRQNLFVDKKNSTFAGLYYAKSAIFADEIKKGVKMYLIEPNPEKLLKDIIETSPIFNDLKNKTDVYISSYLDKSEESKYIRHIRAIFKDPFQMRENKVDRINLQATGEDEATIYEQLKNILAELPLYQTFQNKKIIPHLKILFINKNETDNFIQKDVKF